MGDISRQYHCSFPADKVKSPNKFLQPPACGSRAVPRQAEGHRTNCTGGDLHSGEATAIMGVLPTKNVAVKGVNHLALLLPCQG